MATPYIQRVNRWIERIFNARGGSPVLDGVDSQMQVQVELASGVEDRYLQGWNRFAIAVNVPAVSAQNSRFRIRNPVGSNVIAVVEQLNIFTTTGADNPFATWGAVTTDLTTVVSLTFTRMDPRGNPQPTSIVSFNQQAAGGTPFLQRGLSGINVNADFITLEGQQITNLPGQAVDVQANTANSALVVTCMWRERALEPSELV